MEEFIFDNYTLKISYDDNTNILSFDLSTSKSILSYETKIDLNNFDNSNDVVSNYDMILYFLRKSYKNKDSIQIPSISSSSYNIRENVVSSIRSPHFVGIYGNSFLSSSSPITTSHKYKKQCISPTTSTNINNYIDPEIKFVPYIGYIEILFNSKYKNFKIYLKEKFDIYSYSCKLNDQIIRLKKIIERQKEMFSILYAIPELSDVVKKIISKEELEEISK